MKYGVLGTGMVGQALAGKLVALGHDVIMGSRDAQNPKALTWATRAGSRAQVGTFAETAVFGEVLFTCTHGASSVEALRAAGEQHLADKILVDVANILPPDTRGVESLGEQIQKAFPRTQVVKALNTMNCEVMVDVSKVSGSHTVFMSSDAATAKKTVRACEDRHAHLDEAMNMYGFLAGRVCRGSAHSPLRFARNSPSKRPFVSSLRRSTISVVLRVSASLKLRGASAAPFRPIAIPLRPAHQ
jgi:predicted dinucleotide-binding enzyme